MAFCHSGDTQKLKLKCEARGKERGKCETGKVSVSDHSHEMHHASQLMSKMKVAAADDDDKDNDEGQERKRREKEKGEAGRSH